MFIRLIMCDFEFRPVFGVFYSMCAAGARASGRRQLFSGVWSPTGRESSAHDARGRLRSHGWRRQRPTLPAGSSFGVPGAAARNSRAGATT